MRSVATFTTDDVRRLAHLARLELSSDELEVFTRQLQEIREFAEQINAVDTSAVAEAIGGPLSGADTLREDTVRPGLDRNDVLALAPSADRRHGLFKVPRVLNG